MTGAAPKRLGLAALTGLAVTTLSPSAGHAMCGGNIFMTCPPSAKAAVSPEKATTKAAARRHKRLVSPGKPQ